MRKLIPVLAMTIFISGCYKEFRTDYTYTTVAFSSASGGLNTSGVLGRTVVSGEGLQLDFGVYLAGVLQNKNDRWVKFVIDPSLLAGTPYKAMPQDYYTLSDNSEFKIPAGEMVGKISVSLDSAKFVSDPLADDFNYAIPFRLTETSEDSILATQDTKILVIKYINHFDGFYDQTGSFETFDPSGLKINEGDIKNVIQATTLQPDIVRMNGVGNQIGDDFQMDVNTDLSGKARLTYYKNPNPPVEKNIAIGAQVSTSSVSPWETLNAVNDGLPVNNSGDVPRYGNWPNGVNWQWVQYNFPNTFSLSYIRVYWGSDGGGLLPPTDSYVQYKDLASGSLVTVPASKVGTLLDQFNRFTFSSPIVTNTLRLNFIGDASIGASTSIIEWEAYGVPAPVTPEQAPVESIALSDGQNDFDYSGSTYHLNYRINYKDGNYTIVKTQLVWRNRIRDGVNEWRR